MNNPLVSVICLCYNQGRFVREAVQSVLDQTYPAIELIIVDDGSSDDSVATIRAITHTHPAIKFIPLQTNRGNCAAFNVGLHEARGAYLTDLAADDVFLPERISRQVTFFQELGSGYGVVFTDAQYIDESGNRLGQHYSFLRRQGLVSRVPEGDIYIDVLRQYFISAPTMLVRREVFDFLRGYDEELAYEDFDFWVRSSRHFKYGFLNEVLTLVRRTSHSMSTRLYHRGDRQAYSTYRVCEKALSINKTAEENEALAVRMRYELRQCVITGNRIEGGLFYDLLRRSVGVSLADTLLWLAGRPGLPLHPLRRLYHRLRYS